LVENGAFGETLKRAREARGVPLDAVASATRIARHHLDALERGDLESLPSGPFGRSFLRSYAEFLGIDPEPMLHAYRFQEADLGLGLEKLSEKSIRDLSRLLERRPPRRRFRAPWALGGLVAAVSLFALWWLNRASTPAVEPFVARPAPVAVSPLPPKEIEPDPEPGPPPAKAPSRAAAISVS